MYTVDVQCNGSNLVIHRSIVSDDNDDDVECRTNSSTTFHSQWLWNNSSRYIHQSSGQKISTSMIQYYHEERIIQSATIISSRDNDPMMNDDDMKMKLKRLPPPIGSLHSIGGIYENHVNQEMSEQEHDYDDQNKYVQQQQHSFILHIIWGSNKMIDDDGVTTTTNAPVYPIIEEYYDLNWLWNNRYNDTKMISLHNNEKTRIHQRNSISSKTNLKRYHYHDIIKQSTTSTSCIDDNIRYDLLQSIIHDGAVIVDGTTYQNTDDLNNELICPVAILGRLLCGGTLSHGNLYGNIFHVKSSSSSSDANNIAYTTEALCPHQDLVYYESPPGLQLLYCVRNDDDVIGGESILIDAMAAAEELRVFAPNLFNTLTQCNATFIKQRNGADMIYRRPHIQVSSSSKPTSTTNNNNIHDTASNSSSNNNNDPIISVRWSPPFEGPLLCIENNDNMINEYYMSYCAYQRMIDNSLSQTEQLLPYISYTLEKQLIEYSNYNTWIYKLKPGEILIFNNLRMLHGRRSFQFNNTNSNNNNKDNVDAINDVNHNDINNNNNNNNTSHSNNNNNNNSQLLLSQRHLIGCYTNIDDTMNEYRLLRRQLRFGNNDDHNTVTTTSVDDNEITFIPNVGNNTFGIR